MEQITSTLQEDPITALKHIGLTQNML